MTTRTGAGDPLRVLPLLWRPSSTGRSGISVADVTGAAVRLADADGLATVTMRALATHLGVGTMSVYSYVPGKAELLDLMVDHCLGEVTYGFSGNWRESLREITSRNLALYDAHPWLLDVDTSRPPLGPGTLAKYEAELAAFDGTPLSDVEIDQALTIVLDLARTRARQVRSAPGDDAQWWQAAGPHLAAFVDASRYPRATRIGTAAGQEYDAATDPAGTHAFSLDVLLDGLERRMHG